MNARLFATLMALASLGALGTTCAKTGETPRPGATVKKVTLASVGLSREAMDVSVDPCTDFFEFACGSWLKNTPIPGDQARWSRSFSEIREKNRSTLKAILEKSAADPGDDAGLIKIGDYYAACMATDAIEATGLKKFNELRQAVRRDVDKKGIEIALHRLHQSQIWAVFSIEAEQDFKDATKVIAHLDQAGLGLPDRDYYLKKDKQETREAYREHVARMFKLTGRTERDASYMARDVVFIETELARASMPRVDRRDPHKIYHIKTTDQLESLVPSFWWKQYLSDMGLGRLKSLNVMTPRFFQGFEDLLNKAEKSQWKNYFEWQLLRSAARADVLPEKFSSESFAMRQVLTGQKKQQERWKRCVGATDSALGEILGRVYVEQKFAGRSREDAEHMVLEISAAFERNLATLSWMDDATRERASGKRAAMVYKIGYPKKWRKYPWTVKRDHLYNVLEGAQYELKRNLRKIGKPVDRDEWFMSPSTVNAYYNPLMNEMVFPAGILQPPFYSVNAHVPVNLGGMGMVVGHELTHGFDDSGAQFAGDGNLRDWWTPAVKEKFKAKTQCVVDQYALYEPIDGVKLNGELTQGENIADIGGIKMAFHAYRNIRAGAEKALVAEGFTEDQQFFLGMAQAWCAKARPKYLELMVQTDPHSPARFRVNGSLVNIREFGKAFECKEGARMRPAEICAVW